MMRDINAGKENRDGADQGFLVNHFNDLLDRPMFYPPGDGSRLNGLYRLPLGYQMDASFFCKYNRVLLQCRRFDGWRYSQVERMLCRFEAEMAHSLRSQQRHHVSERPHVEAMVLVVMAHAASGFGMA